MKRRYSVERFADTIEAQHWRLPFKTNANRTILLDGQGLVIACFETPGDLATFLETTALELRRRLDQRGTA